MSSRHKVAQLLVRFEHEEDDEFPTLFEKTISHVPRIDDSIEFPDSFYPHPCQVEEVVWNLEVTEEKPWHVRIIVSS